MAQPSVFLWVLDTRPLWPEASNTKDLPRVPTTLKASRALSLLSPTEQAAALKYHFLRDAKLSLASSLLKRLAISHFLRVPFPRATPIRDARTQKPIFLHPPQSDLQPLLFNVSHQAGVVVLFGAHNPPTPGIAIGTDIVCPGERRDRDVRHVQTEGWPSFVAMHAEVLSPLEVRRMRELPFSPRSEPQRLLDYFYADWCLREAYVKMTGEALLAPWLHDLEMRYFAPPGEVPPEGADKQLEVWFKGERLTDVDVKLDRALDDEYMICTVVKRGEGGAGLEVPAPEILDLEETLTRAERLLEELGE
ncbi:phosphopantetheinyl transferase, putative [Trichoderma parareesei]|uniref:holo-[acyl-carrier-protein] synthase n=1 Tax=Trichoderma parareesei TaxID=858221 RepID=A0A2H2Z7U2_TRIPA|nr:phosphopantetheinyl transferase, putative [Trichoderma parareesei]